MLQGGSRHIATAPLFIYPKLTAYLSSEQKLNLNMRHNLSWWIYRPQEVWEDVYAERCTSAGKCEVATHARIWLDKGRPTDKSISGKYEVDFGEQHLRGNFLVKYREDKTWRCE
jgi:hypothetical protein